MSESQNTEYRESWDDACLRWLCGFANAQGGVIYIGIDDSGRVIGVNNAKRLLEEYKTQEQCQKENEDILMYIQYLRDNGYDISGIETTQNTRGDIGIKLVCERTIQQSKANPGSKSFEEFKQELDEHVDSGKDKRSFLEEFEAEEAESDLSETIELTDGATISYKIQDYKRLASSRNPKNVQNETKKFSESISTKDKIDEERI